MDTRTDVTLTADEYDRLLGLVRRIVNDAAPDRYLTLAEACDRLGVSRTTLYGLFGNRTLTRRNVGRRVFVLESELLDFMRQGGR